jgi:hypothetical protein
MNQQPPTLPGQESWILFLLDAQLDCKLVLS